jgi:hypothetical protein
LTLDHHKGAREEYIWYSGSTGISLAALKFIVVLSTSIVATDWKGHGNQEIRPLRSKRYKLSIPTEMLVDYERNLEQSDTSYGITESRCQILHCLVIWLYNVYF